MRLLSSDGPKEGATKSGAVAADAEAEAEVDTVVLAQEAVAGFSHKFAGTSATDIGSDSNTARRCTLPALIAA